MLRVISEQRAHGSVAVNKLRQEQMHDTRCVAESKLWRRNTVEQPIRESGNDARHANLVDGKRRACDGVVGGAQLHEGRLQRERGGLVAGGDRVPLYSRKKSAVTIDAGGGNSYFTNRAAGR